MRPIYIYSFKKRWAFVFAVLLMVLANYLSHAIPFGGQTMAQVSAAHPTLITPAGYAFSIWPIIYITLIVFAYFQLTRGKERRFYRLVWPYFMINAASNILWLIAFQNQWFGLSILFMAGIVITLAIMLRLFYRLHRAMSTTHRWFFQVPFSMYLGWVSVAAIVNVAVYLSNLNLPLFERYETLFAVVMLVIGALVAGFVLLRHEDYVYSLAVIWAYVAIWAARPESPPVLHTAKFAAIALAAAAAILFISDRIKVARYGTSIPRATS